MYPWFKLLGLQYGTRRTILKSHNYHKLSDIFLVQHYQSIRKRSGLSRPSPKVKDNKWDRTRNGTPIRMRRERKPISIKDI